MKASRSGKNRTKKKKHHFKKRAGFKDEHHLTARSRGGQSVPSNLLSIDLYRHDAWHLLFNNFTLREIIKILLRLEKIKKTFPMSISVYHHAAWNLLFKNLSLRESIELLLRLEKIKKSVKLKERI